MVRMTAIGRLSSEPAMQYTATGLAVLQVNLACKGTKKDETIWLNVKFFGKLAETVSQWNKKGDLICVSGSYKVDECVNLDGERKRWHYMAADFLEMIPKQKATPEASPGNPARHPRSEGAMSEEAGPDFPDLPF